MQGSRFDAFTRWTAQRFTRRTALIQAGAGVAATLGVTSLSNQVVAQDATPAATPVTLPLPAATVPVSLLYVQYAGLTTLVPGEGDVHLLTMTGVQAQTTYFSDRPNRIAGAEPTATFVDGFARAFADSSPNASLIGHFERGGIWEEAVVLTLLSVAYDEAAATLTYEVSLLDAVQITDVAFEQEPLTVLDAPREYAEATLFIDSVDSLFLDSCIEFTETGSCDLNPDCCPARCASIGAVYVQSQKSTCMSWGYQNAYSSPLYSCLCSWGPVDEPTPIPNPNQTPASAPTQAPVPQDTTGCDSLFDCNGPSWDCVCDGSISIACADGAWDTEPGTDCCPASCESNGWVATQPGSFIPEKDCCAA